MQLSIARTDGVVAYSKAMEGFISPDLLIVDDFFTTPMSKQSIVDVFEIIESRVDKGSMILASIIDPEEWHLRITTKTVADSLLGRIVHRAKFIDITGPDMRKHFADERKKKD